MTRRSWILMATLAALWGASYMFIKIAIDDGQTDAFIVFARTVLGALVLLPFALRNGAMRAARRHLGWLALVAVVQILGPFLLITIGEHHVATSLAGVLVASAPIFTAVIAAFVVQSERLHGWAVGGIVVGFVGIALLFGVDLSGDSDALLGGAGILLASVGYAIGALIAKRKLVDVPPIGIATSIIGLTALFLLPALPFTGTGDAPSLGALAALAVLGAGGTGIAFMIFYTLNAEIGPSRAAIVAYIAPVFSVLYGVTLLDEKFTAGTVVGLVLILGGSYVAADGRAPWRRRAPIMAETPA
jgi:drug/metabolite transporter (DMT)-like permease